MNHKKFPNIPEDLLRALEESFPDKIPRTDITPLGLGRLQGEQRVIDFLRTIFERQNKTILEKD